MAEFGRGGAGVKRGQGMNHSSGQQKRCGGYARILGVTFATIAASVLVSACSPYPIYVGNDGTATPRGQSSVEDGSASGNNGEEGAASGTSESPESPDDARPPLEPVIFARVVNDYLGVPFKLGGDDHRGIDCSNLVRNLYRDYDGTRLPASTRSLYRLPHAVRRSELAVGDLVFFRFNGARVSHVGIYLGDGQFVHASESRGVIISSLDDPVYRDRYVGARRVM